MSDDTQISANKHFCPTCNDEVDGSLTHCPSDGTPFVVLPPPKVTTSFSETLTHDPAFFGKYEFLGTIGSGGMGVIYQARQIMLNKIVAIKMVHAHLVSTSAYRRFETEAKATARLSHPYIVQVHDFGRTQAAQPYLVMDYISGTTLADLVSGNGPLSQKRFLFIFKQICEALSYAHKSGILHRDIKPSNIMLVPSDRGATEVRVMDFGIAKLLSDTDSGQQQQTKTGEALGSPPYMSPEQCQGENIDQRSDIYSLGCMMYECLCGTPPFMGNNMLDILAKHISDPPEPLSKRPELLPISPALESLVMRLLSKTPDDRCQTVDDVIAQLEKIETGKVQLAPDATKVQQRNRKALIAGCIAMIAIGAIAALVAGPLNGPSIKTTKPQVLESNEKLNLDDPATLMFKARMRDYIQDLIDHHHEIVISGVGDIVTTGKDDFAVLQEPEAQYVRTVKVDGLKLHDSDLEGLTGLRLEILSINDNKVKDLHALRGMTSLVELQLISTDLNTDGMKVISSFHNLRDLQLDKTFIEDSDLQFLYGLKQLTGLSLNECPKITPTAVAKLRKQLPGCAIETGKTVDLAP
jgi:serine/threonine protein kinase